MKARRMLDLLVLATVMGCADVKSPTDVRPSVPQTPSQVISDGAHGGNPDFWFLPPMVPLPLNNPNFKLGTFTNSLKPSLSVVICELSVPTGQLPAPGSACVGGPVKTFPMGSVQLVNLPLRQNGWWSLFNLPADGFYYVLWDTRQSNLSVSKYYRIKVFVDGRAEPLGYADVDPMSSLREWKYTLTNQVIQLVDDVMLPIPFRVEEGAVCYLTPDCASVTVTNNSPTTQLVTLDAGAGPIAGVEIPSGQWLPANGPQSVVITVRKVPSPISEDGSGRRTVPCHADLQFYQQFDGCFSFTTTPALAHDPTTGHEFLQPLRVAVCYVLQDGDDPREHFAELYASGPGEPAHALEDVSDAGILGPDSRNCPAPPPVITMANPNPLVLLASAGWQKVKHGLSTVFGVKTAYAVDLGLGGYVFEFSNIGPVLPASINAFTSQSFTLGQGETHAVSKVQILGNHSHHAGGVFDGINRLPVTFTVSAGAIRPANSESAPVAGPVTVLTDSDLGEEGTPDGMAAIDWTPPADPGVYTMTASGPATGGPITFTVTVPQPFVTGVVGFDAPDIGGLARQVSNPYTDAATGIVFSADPSGIVGISRNQTDGTSVCVAPLDATGNFGTGDGNQKLGTAPVGSGSIGLSAFPIKATFPTTVPAGTLVSVEVQTGTPSTGSGIVELRFLDASGAQVGSISQTAIGPDVRCAGSVGDPRMKFVLSNIGSATLPAFKSIVVVGPGNAVFLIDNLRFGPPGSFD